MNILLIGNDFDLEHGLPTKYSDFLDFCEAIKYLDGFDIYKSPVIYEEYLYDTLLIGDHIRNILFNIAADRSAAGKGEEISAQKQARLEIFHELCELTTDNAWIRYFEAHRKTLGGNWIDFESEISNVIKTLDDAKKYLTEKRHIDKSSPGIKVLSGVLKVIEASYKDVDSTESMDKLRELLNAELDKLIRALEIYLSCFVNGIPIDRTSRFSVTSI